MHTPVRARVRLAPAPSHTQHTDHYYSIYVSYVLCYYTHAHCNTRGGACGVLTHPARSMFLRRVRLALNVTYSGWHQQYFYSLRVVPVVRLLHAARTHRILLLRVGYTHRTVALCRRYPPHSAAQLQPTPAASYYHWRVVAKFLYSSI